jgi:hypothetical protein
MTRPPRRATVITGILAAILTLAATAAPASAQQEPPTSIAGAYTVVREQGPGGFEAATYPVGWLVTGSHRIGIGRLSAVGELAVNRRENFLGETQQLVGILGGASYPLLSSPRMTIFAQALVGLERFSEPGFTESGLAIQPGVGLDWSLGARLFMRAGADYRLARQTGGTFKELRGIVGAGVRLGR